MGDKTSDQDFVLDSGEQSNTRIAWYYHIMGMTQQQIADRFGLTRVHVNKSLANCRESGVVQVRINSKLACVLATDGATAQALLTGSSPSA